MDIPFNEIFSVGVFIAYVLTVTGIISYFQQTTVTMSDEGTPSAISYKLLSAPAINHINIKNFTRKFIYNISALTRLNNSAIPGMDFNGSYYFVEIRDPSNNRMWRFNNTNFNYAFNALLRGLRPANEPSINPCIKQTVSPTLSSYSATLGGDPFKLSQEAVLYTPVIFLRYEQFWSGQAYTIVDPDSSYFAGAYNVTYPLCICDLPCPASNGCKCSNACASKEVAFGATCGVK